MSIHVCMESRLRLVTTGSTTTTGLLELASFRPHIWCSISTRTSCTTPVPSPVTNCFASETWATKQYTPRSRWVRQGELIEGDNLPTSSDHTSTSSLGDTQCTDLQVLGALEHADIVSHSTHNNGHLPLRFAHELGQLREGEWRPVVTAHKEALQNDFVEVGLGPASKEA